jgi:hypothetical protein
MNWTASLRRSADDALLAVARGSQALVIESVDRAVGVRQGRPTTPLQLLTRLQFALWYTLVHDPAKLVDDRYELAQSLWGLHREFAQRLFDVTDPAKATPEPHVKPAGASILPFPASQVRRSY